jgi:hypothetical protein
VTNAAALLPTAPFEARQRLLTLAAQPDPTDGIAADVSARWAMPATGLAPTRPPARRRS